MKNLPLRTRITLSVFIAIFSVVTLLMLYTHFVSQQLQEKSSVQRIHADKRIWELIISNQASKMRSQVHLFTRDRNLKKALINQDIEQVSKQASKNKL